MPTPVESRCKERIGNTQKGRGHPKEMPDLTGPLHLEPYLEARSVHHSNG